MRRYRNPLIAVLAAVSVMLSAFLIASGLTSSSTAAPAHPAAGLPAKPTLTAASVPAPDVLNVNFADGTPADHAQGLSPQTYGSPAIASDPLLNKDVATFNGSSDAYSYPFAGSWSRLTNGFTFECQLRYNGSALPTGSDTQGFCADNYAGGATIEATAGQVSFAVDINGTYLFTEAAINPGTWYDVVGTWDGTNANLYVDGSLAMSIPASGTLTVPESDAQNFILGANANSGNGIRLNAPVSISAASVWDSALTAGQVAALAEQSPLPAVTAPGADILNVNFASGSPVDYAQGLTATAWGSPTIGQDPTLNTDVASFNGSSGYTFSSAGQWPKFASGFTIECVFRYNGAIPANAQNVICGDTHSGGFSIINNDGDLALQVSTGGYLFAQAPFVTGQWYDAVGTWDGHYARLYINGQLAATTATSATLTDPSVDDFTVGADAPQGGAVNFTSTSSVSEYKVWDAALSPAQVAAEYSQPAGTGAAPDPTVLNVNFADDAPIDYAQGLAETTYGTPTIASDPTYGDDVASFNGSSGYTFNSSAQWSRLADGFTIECVFRYNGAIPANAQNVICGDTHSGGFSIINNDGDLALQVSTGGYLFAQAPFVTGQWYDAIGTWDGTSARLYINGQLAATTATSTTLTDPSVDDFTVGADAPQGGAVNFTSTSTVQAYKIWDTALSASQVTAESANPIVVTSGGNGTASASVNEAPPDTTVTLSAQPATGYHLAGWTVTQPADGSVTVSSDNTFTMPAVPVAVTASFAPNTYTVDFNGNGATGGTMADESFTYDQSAALTANGFTDSGSYFAGWATTAAGYPVYTDGQNVQNLTATNGGTVTLYAVWVVNGNYLVDVSSGGHGTASVADFSQTPGATVALTATPATGYHLSGWDVTSPSDGSVTVSSAGTFTMPSQNVAVTAEFAPNTYSVTFDGNGAIGGSMASVTLTYDHPQALPVSTFAGENQVFAGWGTAAAGPVVYGDGATVANLTATEGGTVTLYAQWSQPQVAEGSYATLPAGFITSVLKVPAVPVSGSVSQPLLGLWNGNRAVTFSEVSGDSWLSVSSSGVVTGTAPKTVPQNEGTITVSATDGTTTSQILVEVPVLAPGQAPQVQAVTWNAWDDGASVTDAEGKNLAVIASQGLDVIGFNSGGAQMAEQVASALGWSFYYSGDFGIVSAYPFAGSGIVTSTPAAPAAAVTINVDNREVRVWDTALDSSGYGPYNACFNGVTNPATLIADEKSTTRYSQAQAVAREVAADVRGRGQGPGGTPVILLGDLESPSGLDWTSATASSHCNVGAVNWPVPELFAKAGLTDSFRAANPDPVTDPGNTWSPVTRTNLNGKPEPQDRIDYVLFSGDLHVDSANSLIAGWPTAASASNEWTSNHAAVDTTFTVGSGTPHAAPPAPVVTVRHDTVAYQVGKGPASTAAFLKLVGPAASPASAVSVDLSQVNFSAEGWYTAQVTAASHGYVSNPVDVRVRVAPVPALTLATTTATFNLGDTISQGAVIAQLEPVLDVPGTVRVGLKDVNPQAAGSYPVTVTATDQWGFRIAASATVVVLAPAPVTATPTDSS